MKKLIILILIINLYSNQYYKKLIHMNKYQYEVFNMIWFNAKKTNLQYTLTAIALVESDMGLHKLNLADPSCGIFHKLATEYAKELGMKPNMWNSSRACEELYKYDALSFKIAEKDILKYLSYWLSKGYSYNIAWKYSIMTYNAGYKWYSNPKRKRKAIKYYKNVIKAIKAIKKFNKRRYNEN